MTPLPTTRDALLTAVQAGAAFPMTFFWGHRRPKQGGISASCLSQWYDAPFEVAGETYSTAEHFMMVSKARLFGDEATALAILQTVDPGAAKALGRRVRGFEESVWIAHREVIVFRANWAKFTRHGALRKFLEATQGSILVEASPLDAIWGIGLSQADPRAQDVGKWPGLNLLGFALTQVREQFLGNSGATNDH